MSGVLHRILSGLLIIQFLATPLMAAEGAPQPVVKADEGVSQEISSEAKTSLKKRFAEKRAQFAQGVDHACERLLVGYQKHVPAALQGPIRKAGYITGVIPLVTVLRDPDKTFFVLGESPLIGLATTPASVEMANILSGHGLDFDAKFVTDAKELYISYQGANIIRNGVSIDESLTPEERSWLNWWYSTFFYTWQTAGKKLASAHTHPQNVQAWSQVMYSALWPLFSQRVSQYVITPLLFSKYPRESLLNRIHDTSNSLESLIQPQEALIKDAEAKFLAIGEKTKENKLAYNKAKADLNTARYGLRWIKWFREGVEDGQVISKKRDMQYWSLKTRDSMGAAVAMVTVYLLLRRALVGSEGEGKIIPQTVEAIMKGFKFTKEQVSDLQPVIAQRAQKYLEQMGENGMPDLGD